MKKKRSLQRISVTAYVVTAVLFSIFAIYMFASENNEIYSVRDDIQPEKVESYSVVEVEDASAPIGIHKEYRWTMEGLKNSESCLAFYIVHSYAEVYFDDELIYRLSPGENNHIGGTPSSNWVVVPVYSSDNGREVCVIITPVYESVLNREVEFQIGSQYTIFAQRLKTDLLQLMLALLCILMGIILVIVQLYLIIRKRMTSWDMLYLGNFSLLLGIWRITDTRFSSIMFESHAMALGYITLASLFILAIPLLLFMNEQQSGRYRSLLQMASMATCAVALGCLICQVFGVAELRQTLPACHIMCIADIVIVVLASLFSAKKGFKARNTMICIILLAVGSLADLIYYYLKGTSSGMMITMIAFLIYMFYRFIENLLNINKKAYLDENTKLFNRSSWNEFVEEVVPDDEEIGIVMLDLNHLKYINDTLGHRAGDKMIVDFAGILRRTFSAGEFVCRWGGDEFTVLVRNATREKMENYHTAVHEAVEAHNQSGEEPEIYFAFGYALSAEYPQLSRKELFAKADEQMYIDKQRWYDQYHQSNSGMKANL